MRRIRHTRRALADLSDIWLAIAIDNPGAADSLLDRVEARIGILARWPDAGSPRPRVAADARMLVERPYVILYRVTADGPQIVRVLHGARDIGPELFAEGVA